MNLVYNKYKNKKTVYDNLKFDSLGEKNRYIELKNLEKLGEIEGLETQFKIVLVPKFKHDNRTVREISYIADFKYYDNFKNIEVWEDFKGFETDVFKIKKKLLLKKIVENSLNVEFKITKK